MVILSDRNKIFEIIYETIRIIGLIALNNLVFFAAIIIVIKKVLN